MVEGVNYIGNCKVLHMMSEVLQSGLRVFY